MTYLDFHLLFILPPLILLCWRFPRAVGRLGTRARWTLPLIAGIAFLYTTPWDNYLVANAIWWYGPDRVIGTIGGYVPLEEYLFFLLQPFLTGMFCYHLLARSEGRLAEARPAEARPAEARSAEGRPAEGAGRGAEDGSSLRLRATGGVLGLAIFLAGVLLLRTTAGTYMGLILVWAVPVITSMWLFMAPEIGRRRRVVLPAILVPTVYLWIADRVAIGEGIWEISAEYTLGWNPLGLPVEEATFFLLTNVLVVFGVILFLVPGLPREPSP